MGAAFSSGSRETVDLHREAIVSGQCAVKPVNTGLFGKSAGREGHYTNFSIGPEKTAYKKTFGFNLHDLHYG